MSKWFSAALVALALTSTPARAETASLAGAWVFRADNDALACTITGNALLTPRAEPNAYDVVMTATETCEGQSDAPVGQDCLAAFDDGMVAVQCRVVLIDPGRGYLPDDFLLVIQDADTMVGRLTANWNSPAVWRRRASTPIV